LEYLFQENSRNELLRKIKVKKIKTQFFIEKVVEIINILNGPVRKDLINLCDDLDISNTLIKKLKNPFISKVDKELILYQIGELRSKKQFDYFLNVDRDYIKKHDLYKGYFFVINNIANEWIDDLNDIEINKYIDLVFCLLRKARIRIL